MVARLLRKQLWGLQRTTGTSTSKGRGRMDDWMIGTRIEHEDERGEIDVGEACANLWRA